MTNINNEMYNPNTKKLRTFNVKGNHFPISIIRKIIITDTYVKIYFKDGRSAHFKDVDIEYINK